MKTRFAVLLAGLLLCAGLLVPAQNGTGVQMGKGSQGGGPGQGTPTAKTIVTIEGPVEAVSLGIAQGSPSIVVNGTQIVLGPYSYIDAMGFAIEAGDQVRVEAFASLLYNDLLVAVSVENLTRGTSIQLRDEFGRPLWWSARGGRAGRMGSSDRPGPCGGAPNVAAAQEFTGTVAEVSAGLGRRHPEISLTDGTVFAAGPYRLWAESEFSLAAGDAVTIVAFPCSLQDGKWVVMSIAKPATGEELILRDDTGIPVRGSGWRSGDCPAAADRP